MPDIGGKIVFKGIRVRMAKRCTDHRTGNPVPGERSGKVMAKDMGAAAVMSTLADGCCIKDSAGCIPADA